MPSVAREKRYCSPVCRKGLSYIGYCKNCGDVFERPGNNGKVFCSVECKRKHRLRTRCRLCEHCGIGFQDDYHGTQKYCSTYCGNLAARTKKPKKRYVPRRPDIPKTLRFQILQRDGFRCQYCGRGTKDGAVLVLDHVVPYSIGGATDESNLVTACRACNLGKRDMLIDINNLPLSVTEA
jgi:5-methylcytosine-specific restriction endonuclease McrA